MTKIQGLFLNFVTKTIKEIQLPFLAKPQNAQKTIKTKLEPQSPAAPPQTSRKTSLTVCFSSDARFEISSAAKEMFAGRHMMEDPLPNLCDAPVVGESGRVLKCAKNYLFGSTTFCEKLKILSLSVQP